MQKKLMFLFSLLITGIFSMEVYPVVVLGGGIGGLTSSIYLSRSGIRPLILEGSIPGGMITRSQSVQNWPGEKEIAGIELARKIRNQAEQAGSIFLQEEILSIDTSKRPYLITCSNVFEPEKKRKILADQIIIAMGTEPKKLNVEGEKEFFGKGVSTCSICDGNLYKNKKVAVIGGGKSAVLEADYLSGIAKKVTVILRKNHFSYLEEGKLNELLKRKNLEVLYETEVKKIHGDDNGVRSIILKNKNGENFSLDVEGVFLAIGMTPNSSLFKGKLEMDSSGYILLKNGQRTSKEGIYAIGDIVNPQFKQAIMAASDGAKAALEIREHIQNFKTPVLETQDIKRKVYPSFSLIKREDFDGLVDSSMPVLIKFHAPWCGPCRRLSPVFLDYAEKLKDRFSVIDINIEKFKDLSEKYQITALPTVVLLYKKKVIEKRIGPVKIIEFLKDLEKKDNVENFFSCEEKS